MALPACVRPAGICRAHIETRPYGCVKMFPPKTRADVRMVQCVPARYGKTTWRKKCSNKEEGRSMQRGGGGSWSMQQGGGPVHTKPRSLTCAAFNTFSPSLHLPTFCCIPLYIICLYIAESLHGHGRSVTLTSPGQPGLSFARECMTSQRITSWGLSSNGITSLCPTSWHTPSTRRDLHEGQVCPLVYI